MHQHYGPHFQLLCEYPGNARVCEVTMIAIIFSCKDFCVIQPDIAAIYVRSVHIIETYAGTFINEPLMNSIN